MVQVRVEDGDAAALEADALVVGLFERTAQLPAAVAALDDALGGQIRALLDDGSVTGKASESAPLFTFGRLPAKRVVLAGLGKPEKVTLDRLRDRAAEVARGLRRADVERGAIVSFGGEALDGDAGEGEACAQAITEGIILGLYRFTRHKSKSDEDKLREIAVCVPAAHADAARRGVERGTIIAESVNLCRDMANEPSNHLTPTELAARALGVADEAGLACTILDREEMVELGMGGLLGVAQGSDQPPKFIVLHYRGDPTTDRAVGFVGKGITFDTGGISIKPAAGMEEMKGDMAGGASVIAALRAIGLLKPRLNVTGIVPATENMPGGRAVKPGDVLRAMNGKTIEVVNTDAEGRLILADGLSYARTLDLSPIIDIATLTGAIGVALGDKAYGVISNDQPICDRLLAAAREAGERAWQMPLFEEYKEQIKSDVADMKNSGGRPAGALTAAALLVEFVDETPWCHLDVAGVDIYNSDKGVLVKGASGIPVRTLIRFALDHAADGEPSA